MWNRLPGERGKRALQLSLSSSPSLIPANTPGRYSFPDPIQSCCIKCLTTLQHPPVEFGFKQSLGGVLLPQLPSTLKDLLKACLGDSNNPGTDPPSSSKAKQGMAVTAETTHCQHKYTHWTIQPLTAGKSRAVDVSQSAFFFYYSHPFSFIIPFFRSRTPSLQFV